MKRGVVIVIAALALSGCASIFSGATQEVSIRTTPGAKFSVVNAYGNRVAGGESPSTVELPRAAGYFSPQAYKIKMSKLGYKPRTIDVVPAMNSLYFGNILLGGFVGMVIVDPLTGAMFDLSPRDVDFQLDPTGEDIAALEEEQAIIQKTHGYLVSRHDYTARQVARHANCAPIGNPAVDGINTALETITFACRAGRQLVVKCRSGDGCSS